MKIWKIFQNKKAPYRCQSRFLHIHNKKKGTHSFIVKKLENHQTEAEIIDEFKENEVNVRNVHLMKKTRSVLYLVVMSGDIRGFILLVTAFLLRIVRKGQKVILPNIVSMTQRDLQNTITAKENTSLINSTVRYLFVSKEPD